VATAQIYPEADGRLRKTSAVNWATCQAAVPSVDSSSTGLGQHLSLVTGTYYWDRSYFAFNVAPYAGATISAATLNLYDDGGEGVANYLAYYKDWGVTLEAADWSASLGTAASASFARASGANAITLINLSDILTSNGRFEFVNATETTPSGTVVWEMPFVEHATEAYRPRLDITYTTGPAAWKGLTVTRLLRG